MSFRKWIGKKKESFWEWISPVMVVRIQKWWNYWHRSAQIFANLFRVKILFVLLILTIFVVPIVLQIREILLKILTNDPETNSNTINWAEIISFEQLGMILLIYFIVLLISTINRADKNLVIEEFVDASVDTDTSTEKGIASLLLVELNRINQLYSDICEQRALQTSVGDWGQISAVLKVDQTDEVLKSAIGEGNNIKIGPVELPLYSLASLINRAFNGPRIRGSIKKRDNAIVMTALMSGGGLSFSWKITKETGNESSETGDTNDPIEEAIQELACRIFTDIPAAGAARWEANEHFHKGLRKYRESLRTPKDQIANLIDAESEFLKTLSYDNLFTMAWYNLGVVYLESGKLSAAEQAFFRALEHDPNNADFHYALALIRFKRMIFTSPKTTEDFTEHNHTLKNDILQHCIQAGNLREEYAENFNLMAIVYLEIFRNEASIMHINNSWTSDSEMRETCLEHLGNAITCQKKAVATAWKKYYSLNICERNKDLNRSRRWKEGCHFVGSCIRDLAYIEMCRILFSYRTGPENSVSKSLESPEYLLKTAQQFNRSLPDSCPCPEIHWTTGILHLCKGESEYEKACNEFTTAIRISPNTMKYHISLGLAQYLCDTCQTCSKSVQNKSNPLDSALPLVLTAWKEIENRVRNQWNDLFRSFRLIEWSDKTEWSNKQPATNLRRFKNSLNDLKDCTKLISDSNRLLDVFNPDPVYTFEKFEDSLYQNISESRDIPLDDEIWPTVTKWYDGQISHLYGRYEYLKSDYNSWDVRPNGSNGTDGPYAQSEKYILEAYSEFSGFDKEISNLNLFSKIAIIQAVKDTNYSHAFFSCTQDHWINPFSDYQHSTSALLHTFINDYKGAKNEWQEAILHGYGISDFNHYTLSKYVENICMTLLVSEEKTIIKEDSDRDKKILARFDKAIALLNAGYFKAVSQVGKMYVPPLYCPDTKNTSKRETGRYRGWINLTLTGMDEYDPPPKRTEKTTECASITRSAYLSMESTQPPSLESPDIHKLQADGYLKGIYSVCFKKGEYHLKNKQYEKAITEFKVVSAMCGPPNICRSGTQEEWRGFKEYLISFLKMGDAHTCMKQFDDAINCYTTITDFRPLMKKKQILERFYGYSFRIRLHPVMLLIQAYLGQIRIYAYTGIKPPLYRTGISDLFDKTCDLCKDLEILKQYSFRKTDQDYFDECIHQVKSDCLKYRGMVALSVDNQPKEAIPLLEESIQIQHDAESYIYLLKALDQLIPANPKYSPQISDKYVKSSRYLADLVKIGIPKEDTEFVDKFSKKIQRWSHFQ